MKKIALLFSILMITPCSFAYIYSDDLSNPAFLEDKGYSQTTIKAVDAEKYRSRGSNGTYERYYSKDDTFTKKPENAKEYAVQWYKKCKLYVDPIQDDDLFGEHQNSFENTWFPDAPKTKNVENL